MLGMLLNMSHYVCASCRAQHNLFGSSSALENAAAQMGLPILGKLPLVSQLSMSADRGVPLMMEGVYDSTKDPGVASVKEVMNDLAATVLKRIM
jgi:ATP-binding protein involved in chromosome partitioning